jgi:hypothetical protein
MSRFDYYGLEQDIKNLIARDPGVLAHWGERDPRVLVERDLIFGMDELPCIIIYLKRRDAPSGMQSLSGGQRTRYRITLSIWVADFHFDDVAQACRNRDDLIGLVEVALMRDRDLGGKVGASWTEGGEFLNAETDKGFVSAGEIILIADGLATTD